MREIIFSAACYFYLYFVEVLRFDLTDFVSLGILNK